MRHIFIRLFLRSHKHHLLLEISIIVNWMIEEALRLSSMCKCLISKHLLVDFLSALWNFGESTSSSFHVISLSILKEIVHIIVIAKSLLLVMMLLDAKTVLHIDGVIMLFFHHIHVLLIGGIQRGRHSLLIAWLGFLNERDSLHYTTASLHICWIITRLNKCVILYGICGCPVVRIMLPSSSRALRNILVIKTALGRRI